MSVARLDEEKWIMSVAVDDWTDRDGRYGEAYLESGLDGLGDLSGPGRGVSIS